jgi:Alkylmercury lyase
VRSRREDGNLTHGQLHAFILRTILDSGRAPTVAAIAAAWDLSDGEARAGLRDLERRHGVVLHPKLDEVWVIHPFSAAPTLFSVHSGHRVWWANCAWCSLGAAVLIGDDCRITSTLGGHGERVDLEIQQGEIEATDLLVHFPVPMERVWDNVVYSCSTMLLFDRESAIEEWCRQHGMTKGDVRRVADLWPFVRDWYGNHLSESWEKISVAEARVLFSRHGLGGPVWELPDGPGQF